MSLPIHIALVSDAGEIDPSELTQVAAALSKQVVRDFRPIWRVKATVDAFVSQDDVPIDYWRITVKQNVQGAAGFHMDEDGQPFALVESGRDWSLTASHECLEMLADPFGRRLKAGPLPDQAVDLGFDPGRVEFLVEVCDPSEAGQFAYQVNGLLVSDFYTPHYFDPVKGPGVRYSFTGAIDAPRKVLDGGYLSYHDPVTGHWLQVRMFPDQFSSGIPHVLDLTTRTPFGKLLAGQSLRSAIDRVTNPPLFRDSRRGSDLTGAHLSTDGSANARTAKAQSIRRQIAALIAAARPPRKPTKPRR